jgi:hypothetical protein
MSQRVVRSPVLAAGVLILAALLAGCGGATENIDGAGSAPGAITSGTSGTPGSVATTPEVNCPSQGTREPMRIAGEAIHRPVALSACN